MLIKVTSAEGRVVNYLEYTPGEVVVVEEYGVERLVHKPGTVKSVNMNKQNLETVYDREVVMEKGKNHVVISTLTLDGEAEVSITVSILNKVVKSLSGKNLTLWVLNASPEIARPILQKQKERQHEPERDTRPKKEIKQMQMR